MRKIQNSFLRHGIINIVIHIPTLFFTSFWALSIIGIFDLWTITSTFEYVITMFPIVIPLISCVVGIVRGAIFLKRDKHAKTCLLLSVVGIFLYAGMIALCGWLGTLA